MDSALQLIMDQFKELKKTDTCALGTGQESLKSDICAELKSDMSKIRADLMTQVHAIENKMGNCMSAIREGLETQVSDLCVGQTELEERLDKQQKNVASMVEQQARKPAGGIRGPISSGGSSVQTCGWRRSRGKHHYS